MRYVWDDGATAACARGRVAPPAGVADAGALAVADAAALSVADAAALSVADAAGALTVADAAGRGAMGLLAEAAGRIERMTPAAAWVEVHTGAARLVDVRTPQHRREQGELPGAVVVDLTVLEWRLDPTFAWRLPEARTWDERWILACRHGYSSALAADRLTRMGLTRVADIAGGVAAWIAEGLPLSPAGAPVDVRA